MQSIGCFIMKDHAVALFLFWRLCKLAVATGRSSARIYLRYFITNVLPRFFGNEIICRIFFFFCLCLTGFFISISVQVLIGTPISANAGGPVPSVGNFLEFILQ